MELSFVRCKINGCSLCYSKLTEEGERLQGMELRCLIGQACLITLGSFSYSLLLLKSPKSCPRDGFDNKKKMKKKRKFHFSCVRFPYWITHVGAVKCESVLSRFFIDNCLTQHVFGCYIFFHILK